MSSEYNHGFCKTKMLPLTQKLSVMNIMDSIFGINFISKFNKTKTALDRNIKNSTVILKKILKITSVGVASKSSNINSVSTHNCLLYVCGVDDKKEKGGLAKKGIKMDVKRFLERVTSAKERKGI